jgi:hypothetical protein
MAQFRVPRPIWLGVHLHATVRRLSVSQFASKDPRLSDKRTKHYTGSYAGMTAEHHQANAPAVPGDKDAERAQQSAGAGNAERVSGRPRQGSADDIALLAAHRKR